MSPLQRAASMPWKRWRKKNFDVVLLDVWLPGMDGLECLGKITRPQRRQRTRPVRRWS